MEHTERKFSAGKWDVNGSAVKANLFSDKEVVICEFNLFPNHVGKRPTRQEQIANAYLTSAGPEMLFALEFAKSVITTNGAYEASEQIAIEHINKAIKKANGEF